MTLLGLNRTESTFLRFSLGEDPAETQPICPGRFVVDLASLNECGLSKLDELRYIRVGELL